MSITYEIEVNGDMLRVKASGADDHLDEVKQYGIALIAAAIQNQCVRVLCDERNLQYRLGTFDTFELGQYIAENAPRIAKIAIVCKAEDIQDAAFFETVTTNRGLRVKAFKEVETAIDWLQD